MYSNITYFELRLDMGEIIFSLVEKFNIAPFLMIRMMVKFISKLIFVALILSVSLSGCDSPQQDCYKKNYKERKELFIDTDADAAKRALRNCPK